MAFFTKSSAKLEDEFLVSLLVKSNNIDATSLSTFSKLIPAIISTLFSRSASFAATLSDALSDNVYTEVPLVALLSTESTCIDINKSDLFFLALFRLSDKEINISVFRVRNT